MPARVDHNERREQLARIVWRIVAREGVRAASVRGVAREANMSMGSVRHFFRTQDELLQFAVLELVHQVRHRIAAARPGRVEAIRRGRPIDAVAELLEEVLPLDERRRTEAQVWAAFTAPPVTDTRMAEIRMHADEGIRELCRSALSALSGLDRLHPTRDVERETSRVHALLDGLTLHILLDPGELSPAEIRSLLLTHLGDLGGPPASCRLSAHTQRKAES